MAVYYINEKRVNKITALAYDKSNNKKLPTFMRKGFREIDKTRAGTREPERISN